ncbi:MAG: efflux RND transporter periplasmic adaptor subunit [Kiritimatiellales bacterium]
MNKKLIAVCGIVIVSGLAGWFIHGMFGGKGGGMPARMGGRPPMPPAAVVVQVLKEQSLQPVDEYIAQVEPIQQVTIRPQIAGTIEAVCFKEGDLVKEGDLLFTIEPDSYQATADAAAAELDRAQKLYDRMKSADARSISKSDLETAESNLLRAQANFKVAQVSLNYTKIKAPISGRIGAAKITKGNYVAPVSSVLASIVQIDPIRVVFSVTDRIYLTLRQQELTGTSSPLTGHVRLPNGAVLPAIGKKDFDDNAMNDKTGTLAVRFAFDNADGLLVAGSYVKILLENPDGAKGIKIPQRAVLADQQGSYVLTADEAGTVSTIRIKPGAQLGADVIVLSGLKAGGRIVTDGVQRAVPGSTVKVTVAEDHQ